MFGSALVLSAALVAGGTELEEAEQAVPLTGAASAVAVVGVAMIFLAGHSVVQDHLCSHRALPSDPEGGGSPFECWSATEIIWPHLIAAPSVATLVLASVAGDRWGLVHRFERRTITPRAARGAIATGIIMRLAGLGLVVGSGFLVGNAQSCDDAMPSDDAFHRCLNGNVYGAAAMASGGALLRWSGAGLMTFGFRHRRNQRETLSLSPSATGISGRF